MKEAHISPAELAEIGKITVELSRLRQNECKHLAIENIAPEIFHKLLSRLIMVKDGHLEIYGDASFFMKPELMRMDIHAPKA